MTDWVRFHKELRKGRKKELTRATRFVYLELSSEAREGRGVIQLRKDLPLVDAVLDAIGGGGPRDRKEVREAIDDLADPEHAMIVVDEGSRTITLPSWSKWNHVDSSADRTRNYRARRSTDESDETDRVTRHNVTAVTSRDIGACDSVTEPEERREEEKRSDSPVGPPLGGTSTVLPVEAKPARQRRAKSAAENAPVPDDFAPNDKNRAKAKQLGIDLALEIPFFVATYQANGARWKDWQLVLAKWLCREARDRANRPSQSGIFARPAAGPTMPRPPMLAPGPAPSVVRPPPEALAAWRNPVAPPVNVNAGSRAEDGSRIDFQAEPTETGVRDSAGPLNGKAVAS